MSNSNKEELFRNDDNNNFYIDNQRKIAVKVLQIVSTLG